MKPKTYPMVQRSGRSTSSIDVYAVQCAKCFKWRVIPTQEEYEEIGSRILDDPWLCNKKPDVTCEDPSDLEHDASRVWFADKPNIPKAPNGFQKKVVVRRDFSKCNVYYEVPTGKRVRSISEVNRFLNENPIYKSTVEISDFDFTSPKVMADPNRVYEEGEVPSARKNLKTC